MSKALHDQLVITVTTAGDYWMLRDKGEVIATGHRPTVQDIKFILEYFGHNDGNPVEILEVDDA